MKSAAGYYIGQGYRYKNMPDDGYPLPYARHSGYFDHKSDAEKCLQLMVELNDSDKGCIGIG